MNSKNKVNKKKRILVIGAGPAGLACAYKLAKSSDPSLRLDLMESNNIVGGLSRTIDFDGYLYDIGGHRFYSKMPAVNKLWDEVLGNDFIKVPRISRIYYNDRFYFYPLRPLNTLLNLGLLKSSKIVVSFLQAKIFPSKDEVAFDKWIINRFGSELFNTFFKTYTEKVWGIPCSEIRARWAAQRIKNLSLISAVINAMGIARKNQVKSLIDEFKYPKFGAGQMYARLAGLVTKTRKDFNIVTGAKVVGLAYQNTKWIAKVEQNGGTRVIEYDQVVSSMPLTSLLMQLEYDIPSEIKESAARLKYRDFILVCLVLDHINTLDDTWVYIHDSSVSVGRLQILNNWSPDMMKDKNYSSYAAEYFCTNGDHIWCMTDEQLVQLAVEELKKCKLVPNKSSLVQGRVIREKNAYPVYDHSYEEGIENIKKYMKTIPNLQCIGRYGMFSYNGMDYSIYTGMLAAENILCGYNKFDIWQTDQDNEYKEEITSKEKSS